MAVGALPALKPIPACGCLVLLMLCFLQRLEMVLQPASAGRRDPGHDLGPSPAKARGARPRSAPLAHLHGTPPIGHRCSWHGRSPESCLTPSASMRSLSTFPASPSHSPAAQARQQEHFKFPCTALDLGMDRAVEGDRPPDVLQGNVVPHAYEEVPTLVGVGSVQNLTRSL